MKFAEMFEDTEGGTSSKRAAFFVFIILFVSVSIALFFQMLPVELALGILDKTKELIIWVGAFILGDKTPSVLRAFKGEK